jgi:alanyl-tRNA synthetase
MKDFYPYLQEHTTMNKKLIRKEEESFRKTLKNGQALLDEEIKKAENGKLSGEVVFKLYDTYGYPFELTQEIAQESGLEVDRAEFDAQMKEQKERARNARKDIDSFASQNEALMNFTVPSEFIGYDVTSANGKVIALFEGNEMVDSIENEGQVILDKSCFYAESGGQVADTGTLTADGFKAVVTDVKKARNGQHLLTVQIEEGVLSVNDEVTQTVDQVRRDEITANHSCTHLLQSALKQVLGDHIHQAGSFVGPDYLRFDFSHFEKPTQEQLQEVEKIVNEYIAGGFEVTKVVMDIEEARKSGATALFNEKYGDRVRVVTMGNVSKEFCGGCHVDNTRQIGVCKIVSEESIGSDARRITAKTGLAAYEEFAAEHEMLENIAGSAKSKTLKAIDEKVAGAYDQIKAQQKEIDELKNQIFALKSNEWIQEAVEINGLRVLIKKTDLDGKSLKDIAANLKAKDENLVVVFASNAGGKVVFVAGAGKEAVAKGIHAGKLVKAAASICSGNGGGKPDLAQAGGKDASKIEEALSAVKESIAA